MLGQRKAAPASSAPAPSNGMLRNMLLATGMRMRKDMGSTVATALGTTSRVKLFNVGITTSLACYVTCPITIGTAIAVPSARAPYNLISRLTITDYDGTSRIIISGLQLFLLDSIRRKQPYGYNNQVAAQAGTGLVANPVTPTAIGNGTISFYLEVPIALNDNQEDGYRQDLTGAIFSQTGVGDLFLSIDWNTTLYANTNVEAVYSGAGTTTVVLNGVTGPSVQVWQNYILPQPTDMGKGKTGLPIPGLDLITVYELNGNFRSLDNIAIGAEKLINFPNVRKIIGAVVCYIQNGTMNPGTDLSKLRLIVNGNNVLKEWTPTAIILEQRVYAECDIWPGTYFLRFRDRAIETALFGNVQLGITPSAVASNPYFELLFEGLYTKGAALPGLQQTA